MKTLTLIIVCCIATRFNSAYSQLSNEKKYDFLKNYKAPDFKQRRLSIDFDLGGGNNALYSTKAGYFSENTSLRYYQYANTQKYQGNFLGYFQSRINWDKSDLGTSFYSATGLGLRTTNRFYFKSNWFVGVHGDMQLGHLYRSDPEPEDMESFGASVRPSFSIGNGRLEPIQYARNAMDIEKQLKRGNRLTDPYSIADLNKIAERLAVINNVRFYDYRLRRIEQFEAIDATLKEIGGINEFDIAYFAHLADAYLYAQNFRRFSGVRNELGIASLFRFDHQFADVEPNNRRTYGSNLYYYLSYNLPQSYGFQHTFFTSAIAGIMEYDHSGLEVPYSEGNAWVNVGYELGVYPTTRTNINFGVKAGANFADFATGAEMYANGAVYLSPQFRLSFEANYSPESDYVAPYFMAIPSISSPSKSYALGGSISLSYAIF
ncbi:MAG: hypothetical protein ACI8ZM_003359 [Crocinitomix sp.]|jgi:hypothetical protein